LEASGFGSTKNPEKEDGILRAQKFVIMMILQLYIPSL